jgi:hypothetical protein
LLRGIPVRLPVWIRRERQSEILIILAEHQVGAAKLVFRVDEKKKEKMSRAHEYRINVCLYFDNVEDRLKDPGVG